LLPVPLGTGNLDLDFPLDDENAPGTAAAVMSTDVTFILGQNVTTVAGLKKCDPNAGGALQSL